MRRAVLKAVILIRRMSDTAERIRWHGSRRVD